MSARVSLIVVIALAGVLALACGQESGDEPSQVELASSRSGPEVREAALHELLESVVPDGVEIAGPYIGDCSETLPNPNCIRVNLMWQGLPIEQRIDTVRTLAEASGWEYAATQSLPGGDFVGFTREGYTLSLQVLREELYPNCEPPGERLTSLCRDAVRIYLAR